MKVYIPGHVYGLRELDTRTEQHSNLRFVMRNQPREKYPGNYTYFAGTTTQEVMRVLIDRSKYVHNQYPHWINPVVINLLRLCIWLLEYRAFRRHGWKLPLRWIWRIEFRPTDPINGHLSREVQS